MGGFKLLRPDDIPNRKNVNEKPKLIVPKAANIPIPIIREPIPEANKRKQ